jgi:hypothetical protein
MNDEQQKEQTEDVDKLAQEWLKTGKGRPPKKIAQKVKESGAKYAEEKALEERKETRIQTKAERAIVKDTKKLTTEYKRAQRREEFLKLFIENDGNLTKTGLAFFNTENKESASVMAGDYLKRNQALMRQYLEHKGYSLGWMVSLLAKKAEEGRTPDFLDRLFRLAGYGELQPPKQIAPTIINVHQAQKKAASEFGFEEGETIDGEDS